MKTIHPSEALPEPSAVAGAKQSGLSPAGNLGRTVPPEGFNLLPLPGVRALVLWRGFPYVFQAVMLAVFVALAVVSSSK